MTDRFSGLEQARARLARFGQEHLLRFYDHLDQADRERLLDDISRIDLELTAGLIRTHVLRAPAVELPGDLAPPDILPHTPASPQQHRQYVRARARGEDLIRAGRVACLTVAGGQGTRLGFDGPKGALPVSPVRRKPLFQLFAEQIRNVQNLYRVELPWLVMTSPANDAQTRGFFESNNHFGLKPEQVMFFCQGVMPAVDPAGRILLAERGRVALAPDGHGGTLRAIWRSGLLDRLRSAGVTTLSYFQVDNPLIHPVDPLFIGLHDLTGSQMSSKTIPKSGPRERVGNFCRSAGRLMVIEYSDLPDELAEATDATGLPIFDAASIAIHLLDTEFIARLNRGGFALPFHRALKKVDYVDEAGRAIQPDRPNSIKLETFIFDALPLADRTMVWQTCREEEFAPVKNASGPDSLATCQAAMVARWARWLAEAGVQVPTRPDGSPDAVLEISPLLADSAEQLAGAIQPSRVHIAPGGAIYLGTPDERSG